MTDSHESPPLRPIEEIAQRLGVAADGLYRYGPFKAKLDPNTIARAGEAPKGRLVLVTAINPTPAGEGKTTTTIGLGDALTRLGAKAAIALREPSLGPCFGAKGGAIGGGRSRIAPEAEINLHFTGDLHAIAAAHNLLAAMLDNSLHWGNPLGIDPGRVAWRRVLDVNDRALRQIIVGLGAGNGVVREAGFDIVAASEVMAVFCLAADLDDLKARLGRMVVAERVGGGAATAADLGAVGAMTALLADALRPNLVQTLEGTPALVHGGPFANIAHGCSSVIATRAALGLADIVVTEAGFGADLGAEKFLHLKCRQAGLAPDAAVVVATVRALKMHGGTAKADLARPDPDAVRRGLPNLLRHLETLARFGVPAAVAINGFSTDAAEETAAVVDACAAVGVTAHPCRHFAEGGAGALALARHVQALAESGQARLTPLYADDAPLIEKARAVARGVYGADDIALAPEAAKRLAALEAAGHGRLPVCMAKTQYSLSADPGRLGAPTGFTLPIREARLSAGAGFVVLLCGDIRTMPGLGRRPAALEVDVDPAGHIVGLA